MQFEEVLNELGTTPLHIVKGEDELFVSAFIKGNNNDLVHAITNKIQFSEGNGVKEFFDTLVTTLKQLQTYKKDNNIE